MHSLLGRIVGVVLSVVVTHGAVAQTQLWSGKLAVPGVGELELVFRITPGEGGGWTGEGDVAAQGILGAPLEDIEITDDSMSFRLAIPQAPVAAHPVFELVRQGDHAEGKMTQGGAWLPFAMDRTSEEAMLAAAIERRPQTPRPPFEYRTIEVRVPVIVDGEVSHELAGTLTLPNADTFGDGPYPCVVTVSGTGPQDRDETLVEHKPFLIIADALAKRGVATLRCDDRGVGASGGDYASAACTDFAADARAQVDYLLTRPEIDPERIGMLGHSEGGLTVPMAAADNEHVAFVVLLAGMAIRGDHILTSQSAKMFELRGLQAPFIEESNRLRTELIEGIRAQKPEDELLELARALVRHDSLGMLPEPQLERQARFAVNMLNNAWGRELISIDPASYIARLDQPVLAITGSLDCQVLPELNLAATREALERGGNTDHTVFELEGLNHLFQNATTGAIEEYAQIRESFDPEALELVVDWIAKKAGVVSD